MTEPLKRFKVRAVLKYHRDVGTFEAASLEDAIKAAEESEQWDRISYSTPGGIYDVVAEELI